MRGAGLLVAAVLAWVLAPALVGACGGTGGSPAAGSPVAPGGPVAVVSPVVGVPIDIDAEGFSRVTAFVIRTDDGAEIRFAMGDLENGAEFPPNHLAEHLAGSTHVRVFFREEGGERVAYRLEDADPIP